MKASELRIGNLLEFKNGIQQDRIIKVGRRFFSSAAIERDDGDFDITPYYKPIPITEEWLLKFGFDKTHDKQWSERLPTELDFLFSKDDCHIAKAKDIDGFAICNYDYYGIDIDYVHQLQNLYFALKGKELESNEKDKTKARD